MSATDSLATLPSFLAEAMAARGFEGLTAIQAAVAGDEHAGKDLRLSSQTGSGKTVAFGIVCAQDLQSPAPRHDGAAQPRVLMIAPTRELAAQIGKELRWLYAGLGAQVIVVTGGTNLGSDFSNLRRKPDVLVGTPGRLVDHLTRGKIDLSCVTTVVLDEADEMLDMGFREALETILEATPETRRTHMVSATMPKQVIRLADKYQSSPQHVQGTQLGSANSDIRHVRMHMREADKERALINVLLMEPQARTLVFVRTRAATTRVADKLRRCGFAAAALSGEMSQRERTATLQSFRDRGANTLVATDVAARGLDIQDVTRVVHFDLPENAQAMTHRSGRTGRAGNTGVSIAFATRNQSRRCDDLYRRAKIKATDETVPTRESIEAEAATRLAERVKTADAPIEKHLALAKALLRDQDPVALVAQLLARTDYAGPCAAQTIDDVPRESKRGCKKIGKPRRTQHEGPEAGFRKFHVNRGRENGATPAQLLQIICKRGAVSGSDIGRINIDAFSTTFDVSESVANDFIRQAKRQGKGDKLKIREWRTDGAPTKDAKPRWKHKRKKAAANARKAPHKGPRKKTKKKMPKANRAAAKQAS